MARHDDVLEIRLEEIGTRSWLKAIISTLSGSYGSAMSWFVASAGHGSSNTYEITSGSFPVMRLHGAEDDDDAPAVWLDLAREQLAGIDDQLIADGWLLTESGHPHWWSRHYSRPVASPQAS